MPDLDDQPAAPIGEARQAPASIVELTNRDFQSMAEAKAAVVSLSEANGFAVAIKRAFKMDSNGLPQRCDLECVRGTQKASKGTGKRQAVNTRENCPWSAYLRYYKGLGCWRFVLRVDEHSHPSATNASHFAISRRRQRKEFEGEIGTLAEGPMKRMCKDIAREVGQTHPEAIITARDVQNLRDQNRVASLHGRTPTQQLLEDLNNDPDARIMKRHLNNRDDGPIISLMWTYNWAIAKWKENPEVLSFDNTYKTNRFNMPLLQITGITNLSTTFNVAWALLSDEAEGSFEWAITQLRTISVEENIAESYVCISDYDRAFRNAWNAVHPDVFQQLCRWHIMKNVAFHVKVKWNGTLEGTALGETLGGEGSRIRNQDQQDNRAGEGEQAEANAQANALLEGRDRGARLGGENPRNLPAQQPRAVQQNQQRRYENSADGLLEAWKATVYAGTFEDFDHHWQSLCAEFADQEGK